MADLLQKIVDSKIGTADTRKLEDTKGWDFSDESGSGGASITPFNPAGETSFAGSVNQTQGTIKTFDGNMNNNQQQLDQSKIEAKTPEKEKGGPVESSSDSSSSDSSSSSSSDSSEAGELFTFAPVPVEVLSNQLYGLTYA